MNKELAQLIKSAAIRKEVVYRKSVMPQANDLRTEIEEILVRIVSTPSDEATIRIFQGNGTRDDHLRLLKFQGLTNDIPIETQLDAVFGDEYCIAINYITSWSTNISEICREHVVKPWIESIGPTFGGIDIYAFIGKYRATPFGVHADAEDTFLIGLGPHVKSAFVQSTTGSDLDSPPIYEIAKLPPVFDRYELSMGDFLYIPKGQRHILSNPNYSVTLGIAPYPFDKRLFLKSALDRLAITCSRTSKNFDYGSDLFEIEELAFEMANAEHNYPNLLTECLTAEYTSRISGGFLSGAPFFDFEGISREVSVRLRQGQKVEIVKVGAGSFMFFGGRELFISVWDVANILAITANKGDEFSIESLASISNSCITEKLAEQFITELGLAGVIENV